MVAKEPSASRGAQRFKSVARRNPQIVNLFGRVNGKKLGSRPLLNLVRYTLGHRNVDITSFMPAARNGR
jgi:hypothetical protein